MKELTIGDQTVRVRATPMALLFYKQEFKSDLLADLSKMVDVKSIDKEEELDVAEALSRFDVVTVYQIIWAMAKADSYGSKGSFPSFVTWFAELDGASIYDEGILAVAMEEAADGFFRTGAKYQPKGRKK